MVYHAEEKMTNDRPTDRCTIGDVCLLCFSTWHIYMGPPYLLRKMSDIYCLYLYYLLRLSLLELIIVCILTILSTTNIDKNMTSTAVSPKRRGRI